MMGGEPRLWLKNASALVWTGPRDILFSETKVGSHMGIVAAEENRTGARDVYLPAEQTGMAHRSYVSPNGQWVLLVEMDQDGRWVPCRVVPMHGSITGHRVGPSGGACTAGAWSPEGKWMYLTSNATGAYHIWRQRFPNGRPEQITSGPTEEEGIAMMPDGRSFITAVALQSTALWIHDAGSDRGISVEGNTAQPRFTPDGSKLCYRNFRQPPRELTGYGELGEVSVADLRSGRSEPLAPGFLALDYDISVDGRQVVMEAVDDAGKPRLWLAPFDRSSPPSQVPNVEGSAPRFGPGGEIFFRRVVGTTMEGSIGRIYRVHPDGTGLRKAFEDPVLLMGGVSPDRRWLWATAPVGASGSATTRLFPLDGGPAVPAGDINLNWSPDGRFAAISSDFPGVVPADSSYLVPLPRGQALPPIPTGGFRSEQQIAHLPRARRIEAPGVTVVLGNSISE
jgi:Tol biopolymer transport system component